VSIFNKNTRRVLSYDVLQQQKTGVMTKGVVSGGFDLHTHAVVCSTLAAVRRGCFSVHDLYG